MVEGVAELDEKYTERIRSSIIKRIHEPDKYGKDRFGYKMGKQLFDMFGKPIGITGEKVYSDSEVRWAYDHEIGNITYVDIIHPTLDVIKNKNGEFLVVARVNRLTGNGVTIFGQVISW